MSMAESQAEQQAKTMAVLLRRLCADIQPIVDQYVEEIARVQMGLPTLGALSTPESTAENIH